MSDDRGAADGATPGPAGGTPRAAATRADRRHQILRLDFLPGALEIQEKPPSPAAHWLLGLLLLLFSAGILWAAIGEVDIVVSAPGRVVPSGQVKVVQAPAAGSVAAIHVRDVLRQMGNF